MHIRENDILIMLKELHPDIDFEREKNLVDDEFIDSFDVVSIIAEIGERFDVTIGARDITPENFNSVEKIAALVQKAADAER